MIVDVEEKYLPMLFGLELYELFIADWDLANPDPDQFSEQRFIDVYEKLLRQDQSVYLSSEGIKFMLKAFTYWEYVDDLTSRVATTNIEKILGENGESISAIKHDVVKFYNRGVDTYKTIQYFMSCFNKEDYPEYCGVNLNFTHPF